MLCGYHESLTHVEINQHSYCDLPHQHGQQEDDEHPQQAPGVSDGPTASQESHHRAQQSKSKNNTGEERKIRPAAAQVKILRYKQPLQPLPWTVPTTSPPGSPS